MAAIRAGGCGENRHRDALAGVDMDAAAFKLAAAETLDLMMLMFEKYVLASIEDA